MANRLLLTLLALLTGLAAPAQAREARGAQITAEQVAQFVEPGNAQAPRAPVALARLPEPGFRNTRIVAPARHDAVPAAPVVATSLTGIDRARE